MPRLDAKTPPRLLRVRAAAHYLGVGPKHVRALVMSGKLPFVQMKAGGNSPFLIDRHDLDKFIEENKS